MTLGEKGLMGSHNDRERERYPRVILSCVRWLWSCEQYQPPKAEARPTTSTSWALL